MPWFIYPWHSLRNKSGPGHDLPGAVVVGRSVPVQQSWLIDSLRCPWAYRRLRVRGPLGPTTTRWTPAPAAATFAASRLAHSWARSHPPWTPWCRERYVSVPHKWPQWSSLLAAFFSMPWPVSTAKGSRSVPIGPLWTVTETDCSRIAAQAFDSCFCTCLWSRQKRREESMVSACRSRPTRPIRARRSRGCRICSAGTSALVSTSGTHSRMLMVTVSTLPVSSLNFSGFTSGESTDTRTASRKHHTCLSTY